jgi:hypothetical protein
MFSASLQTGPGVQLSSYTMDTGSCPGIKRTGRGVDHPPHLVPRLPRLGLRALLYGELYSYLYPYPYPSYCSRYSDSLRAARSGYRVQGKARFSVPVHTGPDVHRHSCTVSTTIEGWYFQSLPEPKLRMGPISTLQSLHTHG